MSVGVGPTEMQLQSAIRGTGTYLPMTFYTGGSERMRLDTSGNLLLGTATGPAGSRLTIVGGGTQLSGGTTAQEGVRIQRATGYATFTGINNDNNAYNGLQFFTSASAAVTIDTSGNVGIGGTANAFSKLGITGTLPTSSNTTIGVYVVGTIPSGTTTVAYSVLSRVGTAAASFTLSSLKHFQAEQATFGAGSTVTNQYGFLAESTLTGATNNYGFYSNIASAANRWNFYAAGTAQNYFAGDTGVGTTPLANVRLGVLSAGTTSGTYAILARNSSSTDLFSVRSDGLFQTGTNTESPANKTTATAANVVVDTGTGALQRSTSSLRYKTNVVDATHGLADVLKLRSVTYKGKNDGDKVFGGLIAEEVHDAGLTEFVAYDKEGRPDALHYGNMVALLVKADEQRRVAVVGQNQRTGNIAS
ncbi:hypothetical protein EBZ39_10660 [bacterium]|nr:hypothetical protein [bacterium]